ncbi:hypothetical protein H0E87_017465 [Populus deltoides]|uniref:SWIM-type domain-containing protein n=1 Tax=Populus deltoides TaxID=3696 RepID=A0A8T2Y0C6_POPDE|nr:hypothetical protein H0E87_017465 [Populus deltoides]
MEKLNQALNRRNEETETIIEVIRKGKTLVVVCSKTRRYNCWRRQKYTDKLVKLEESVPKFFFQTVMPKQTVALGEFKMELFKDGMSIAVLSAPPGCGKTTSAKLPCHVSYRQNYLVITRLEISETGHSGQMGISGDPRTFSLHFLFGKNLERATKIVDQRGVKKISGQPSGRSIFQVVGESRRKEEYFCFPEHYCACYSFFYDIVNRGEQLCCKHQLAARLAAALGAFIDVKVSDEQLALLLVKL